MLNIKKLISHPLDIAAISLTVISIIGVLWSPKISNYIKTLNYEEKSLSIKVDLSHSPIANPMEFIETVKDEKDISIVIRNQPSGQIIVEDILIIHSPYVLTPGLSNTPIIDSNITHNQTLRFDLRTSGYFTKKGYIVSGTALKIGSPITLEGDSFRLKGFVSEIKSY